MRAALRHQRADGADILTVGCDAAGCSRLRDLYQRAPCRMLFPDVEREEPLQAVLLTTTGGLTGGDRTSVTFNVGADARATLTTQAAEKLYRALPTQPAVMCTVSLTDAKGGPRCARIPTAELDWEIASIPGTGWLHPPGSTVCPDK